MDIRTIWLAVVALLLAAPIALSASQKPIQDSPTTANSALLAGLWSLTTQPQAITLADLTKQLRIDLHDYKVDGSPRYYVLSALDEQTKNKVHSPIRSLTFWTVAIVPGVQGNQELRIQFDDAVCVSTNSVAPYVDSPLMTESFPCPDNPACSSEITYFYAAGKNRADKRLAVGSQLRVPKKCSQGVVVAKTFDKDYWLALCPFSYNKQVRENVIADAKKNYPDAFASFDLEQPQITDYSGPTMRLSFRGPDGALRAASLNMEVDRCDLSVVRSWGLPQPK